MRPRRKGGRARLLLLVALLVAWGLVLHLSSGENGATILRAAPSPLPASPSLPAASGAPSPR